MFKKFERMKLIKKHSVHKLYHLLSLFFWVFKIFYESNTVKYVYIKNFSVIVKEFNVDRCSINTGFYKFCSNIGI